MCRLPPRGAGDDVTDSFHASCVRTNERAREEGRLAAKQQGGRAMATLARLIPSPDSFLSEPWSSFVGAVQLRLVDESLLEKCHGEFCGVNEEGILRCRRLFPVLEDFHLVVCHVCNQVLTPQGFLTHYGSRGLASQ
uniref:Uncharacterized protein n=1 Tax=Hippocampus comes TaxID=109280 RepID=A0A3Q3DVH7_HIPCM